MLWTLKNSSANERTAKLRKNRFCLIIFTILSESLYNLYKSCCKKLHNYIKQPLRNSKSISQWRRDRKFKSRVQVNDMEAKWYCLPNFFLQTEHYRISRVNSRRIYKWLTTSPAFISNVPSPCEQTCICHVHTMPCCIMLHTIRCNIKDLFRVFFLDQRASFFFSSCDRGWRHEDISDTNFHIPVFVWAFCTSTGGKSMSQPWKEIYLVVRFCLVHACAKIAVSVLSRSH